jgi:sugar lactone lactonase YvrE
MKLKIPAFLFGLLMFYLFFSPVTIDPVAWVPPKAPELTGKFKINQKLSKIRRIPIPSGKGAEDLAIDSQGRLYGGIENGNILRYSKDFKKSEVFANTGGRPLGMHFDSKGNLIVADAKKGLLSVSPAGKVRILSKEAGGVPFKITDDVDIAKNGLIYFTDASSKYSLHEYRKDGIEHRPNGRLLVYNPDNKTTKVLLDKLYFANGVAVAHDQKSVMVVETWKYRVIRYWLEGTKKGKTEILIENLPGFPDGISAGSKQTFWIAIPSTRNPTVDVLAPYPFLRKVIVRLPEFIQPDAIPYAFVLGVNSKGKVIHNLQEPSGKSFAFITSVQEHQGRLFFGSLREKSIGYFVLAGHL